MRANNCFPAPAAHRYPFKEPILGLDFALQIVRAAKSRRFLDYLVDLHKRYSPTMINHTFSMYLVWTDEPENIKTALSTRFDDWAIGPIRQVLIKDLLGDGIFTTDGAYWQHSRAMVRPNFARDQVADLDALEEHMQNLLALLPRDGSTVDLQELFHRYSMDASTEFLMGESTRTLLPGHSKLQEQFAKGIELGLKDATDRSQRGWFYHLISHAEVKAAIREVRRLVDPYVEHALEYRRKHLEAKERGEAGVEEEKYVFLHELAKETDDPLRLKNEVLNFLVAGRDTTASLLSTLWFMLARYPRVWKKLQAEVDGLEGKLPTYEKLRNMRYLKHCASETLRLYPPVPLLSKIAIKDTLLPLGGGPDGQSPLFVPEGGQFVYNMWSMHRRKDIFGEDALDFNPDRWESSSLRPGWGYLPFGGGPRVCLGQQYALTETYYVTIRLMQHFHSIEPRDPEPWTEKVAVTLCSLNGTQVGLFPA
ncbi:hypothetical protein H2203_001580 [Taxawa tesnikishii (nom. ined.)]|nr:hypothetical protein H2203_001580 [Dothideales sp. JES 119]